MPSKTATPVTLKCTKSTQQRKYDRYVVWDTDKYGRELYMQVYCSTKRVLYPNDTVTLVLLLQKFETKNCK
jgi:hypothetical protein